MRSKSKGDIALQEIKVDKKSGLLAFLIDNNVRKSRNAVKSLLAHKQIKVNGKLVTQFDFELQSGDWVSIMKFDQSRKEKRLKGLKIVFEDEDFIVVDKEAGFLSVSTDKEIKARLNSEREKIRLKLEPFTFPHFPFRTSF